MSYYNAGTGQVLSEGVKNIAGRKEYELLMKLTAALAPNFNSTFKTATKITTVLQDSIKKAQETQKNVDSFKKVQEALIQTKKKVEDYAKKHDELKEKLIETITKERELRAEVRKAERNTAAAADIETYKKLSEEQTNLQRELSKTTEQKRVFEERIRNNATELENATRKIQQQEESLSKLSEELQTAGISAGSLTEESEKLKQTLEDLEESQKAINNANSELEKSNEAVSESAAEFLKAAAATTAFGTALALPIKGAMEFESNMSEVAKVVDWIGNGNTATADQIQMYNELGDGLYNLTRKIPMSVQGFAEIAAAAGQASVATDNESLLEFTSDAAKMGIAFDVSAEQAGEYMAQWRTAFKMSQDEVVELSDVINYLGNTTAANAAQISNVVTEIGPLGEVAGLSSKELAAMGAAIVGVGINENVAATGIKNLMLDMTKGTAATDAMKEVLGTLGTSAEDLAGRMQTDATGAIMDFMRAVQKLPEAEQAATLTTYFGQESVAAIAPLLSNLNNLESQFNAVGDASLYAGSMESEFAARAATSENTLLLLQNAVNELSDAFGMIFVPNAENGTQALTEMIYKTTDFVKENKETISTVIKVTAGILAARTAYLGIKTTILAVISVVKGIKVAMAAYQATQAAIAAGTGVWAAVSAAATTPTAALGAAMAAVSWPVLAVVAAIAAAIAIAVLLIKNWDTVKAAAISVGEGIKEAFGKAVEYVGGAFETIKNVFSNAFNRIAEITQIKPIIDNITGAIGGLIDFIKNVFAGNWEKAWQSVITIFQNVFGGITGVFKLPINTIIGGINFFLKELEKIEIPDWVPGVGGKKISIPPIPKLEKGSNFTPDTFIAGDVNGKGGELITGAKGRKVFTAAETNEILKNISTAKAISSSIPEMPESTFGSETTITPTRANLAAETSEILKNINAAKAISNTVPVAPPMSYSDTPKKPTEAEKWNGLLKNINTAKTINSSLPTIPQVSDSDTLKIRIKAEDWTKFIYTNDAPQPLPPELPKIRSGGIQNFTINYNPTIQVNGDKPGDLEEKLKQNNKELLEQFKAFLRKRDDDERRMRYA